MSTSSRRLSQKLRQASGRKNQHTPGKTKGQFCVKPKDSGTAMSGNPYKGAGLKGNALNSYTRLWDRYKNAKGNK